MDIIARIDALLANTLPSEVEEFEVCRCLRDAKGEIERLRKIRSPWGDDPSGPYYSDEYLEGLKRREEFDQKAREGVIDLNVLYPPTP
jgi:hypothetical protein